MGAKENIYKYGFILAKKIAPEKAKSYEAAFGRYSIMVETFVERAYKWLIDDIPKNTVVIDIGANIGDTTVYFAQQDNVTFVHGYEPFPTLYREALKNVALSKLNAKISLHNEAVSNKNGDMLIPDNFITAGNIPLRHFESGKSVRRTSLNSILASVHGNRVAIKSDCEGSEHEIFDSTADLSKVIRIQMEFHEGIKNLRNVLKKNGFKVRVRRYNKGHRYYAPDKDIGMLYAWR